MSAVVIPEVLPMVKAKAKRKGATAKYVSPTIQVDAAELVRDYVTFLRQQRLELNKLHSQASELLVKLAGACVEVQRERRS